MSELSFTCSQLASDFDPIGTWSTLGQNFSYPLSHFSYFSFSPNYRNFLFFWHSLVSCYWIEKSWKQIWLCLGRGLFLRYSLVDLDQKADKRWRLYYFQCCNFYVILYPFWWNSSDWNVSFEGLAEVLHGCCCPILHRHTFLDGDHNTILEADCGSVYFDGCCFAGTPNIHLHLGWHHFRQVFVAANAHSDSDHCALVYVYDNDPPKIHLIRISWRSDRRVSSSMPSSWC